MRLSMEKFYIMELSIQLLMELLSKNSIIYH
jgi:hypothetical protein